MATLSGFCNYFDEFSVFSTNNSFQEDSSTNINDFYVETLNETEFKDTLIMSLIKFNDECDLVNTTAK